MKRLPLPKEHGAWAMLYVPFALGALVAGRASWGLILLWVVVTAVFVGREALVGWGRARIRGRAAKQEGKVALVWGAIAALAGWPLVTIWRLDHLVGFAAAAGAILAWHFAQSLRREERTTLGEILTIVGLSMTAPAAYYVGAATLDARAWWLWGLAAAYFMSSVFYVKARVLAIQPRRADDFAVMRGVSLAYHGGIIALLVVLTVLGTLHGLVLLAFVPATVRALRSAFGADPRLRMVRVGVLEIIYAVTFLVCATLAFQ